MSARAVALILLVLAGIPGPLNGRQEAFPHGAHARLFPLCESCHAGIASGVTAEFFPTPARCASCHDGTRERAVEWRGPQPHVSNLSFSHVEHAGRIRSAGDSLDCRGCHVAGGGAPSAVSRPDPERCLGCHAHEAPTHLSAGRDCTVCHAPLVGVPALSAQRLAAFPRPAAHEAPDFLLAHAPARPAEQVACATCHARESCTRCHMNAATVPAITALGSDARIAGLVRERAPEYPAPASHRASSWSRNHGGAARADAASCGNCHAQNSCATCHRDRTPAAVAALPRSTAGDGRGVVLPASVTRVHAADFTKAHAPEAVVATASCESCHAASFCESCHTAPAAPRFHAANFLARHAPEAYGNDSDCSSCHNPEVFCRACHAGVGLSSQGRLGVAFHTANAFWIVGHGAAARQGLEGCAGCHAQSTCLQCHSSIGGWRINPHGTGAKLERMESANPLLCRRCHTGRPGS
jgi:hypothetical protein